MRKSLKSKSRFVFVAMFLWLSIFLYQTIYVQLSAVTEFPQSKAKSLKKVIAEFEQEQKKEREDKKEPEDSKEEPVSIKLKTELVVERFSVFDRSGQLITDLEKDDFIVHEDKIAQKIESFATLSDVTRKTNYILVMDASSSVHLYFADGMRGINYFIDQLSGNERLAIIDQNPKILSNYTASKQALKDSIKKYNKKVAISVNNQSVSGLNGESNPVDALVASLAELTDEEAGQQVVIFQSDADQYPSLKDSPCTSSFISPGRDTEYTSDAVLKLAKSKNVRLYSIIQRTKLSGRPEDEAYELIFKEEYEGSWTNKRWAIKYFKRHNLLGCYICIEKWMTELAETTGGWAAYLNQPESAQDIYARILAETRQSYALSYYPTNTARDGKWREVKITIKDHPEYIVRGRKGYYAAQN